MTPATRPDVVQPLVIDLTEWEQVSPVTDPRLKGLSLGNDMRSRRLAETLRGRLNIRERYDGLEIASTQFVGRVDVGPVRIVVKPKLPTMPLARLLRYAYSLRNIATVEETHSPNTLNGLQDLLIALLAAEVEELLHRGLARRYNPMVGKLESPRGRILVDQVIREGGLREARLPCKFFERSASWHLNQVLRAGLEDAARRSEDFGLRRRLHKLSAMFADIEPVARLDYGEIDRAERELTRQTAASLPALTIIRLLQDDLGVAFDTTQQVSRMPGFLFDMNVFFQRLISRFLHDNLTTARIADERPIRKLFAYALDANPRKRSAPSPRPDYALFRDNKLYGFLDAKYRDVWELGLRAEWLYQLSIYALAAPCEVSVLLYASMSAQARDERVEIRQPIPWSSKEPASVIVRPVPLPHLAELLDPDRAGSLAGERAQLADQLVMDQVHKHSMLVA